MKKLIYVLGVIAAALAFVACSDDNDDVRIELTDAPAISQAFVSEHFNAEDVRYVEVDSHSYEVKFKNGTEVKFDKTGVWKKVDMNRNPLPQTIALLINPKVFDYVTTHYPAVAIEEIERKGEHIVVELVNDKELLFYIDGTIVLDPGNIVNNPKPITINELPVAAQEFLIQYFADIVPASVKKDTKEYEVEYADGTEIEFDLEGNFKSIEVESVAGVPEAIVNPEVLSSIKERHPNRVIEEYTKLSSYYTGDYADGYEVELSGKPELKLYYTKAGVFLKEIAD